MLAVAIPVSIAITARLIILFAAAACFVLIAIVVPDSFDDFRRPVIVSVSMLNALLAIGLSLGFAFLGWRRRAWGGARSRGVRGHRRLARVPGLWSSFFRTQFSPPNGDRSGLFRLIGLAVGA
jgi:hypothetical protein